jgi:hypothetical protein
MADPEKLGGFKVLKEAALISPDPFELDERLPLTLFHLLSENRINLPYVTCILKTRGNGASTWSLTSKIHGRPVDF